jgi:methoxymalonate biosynthesis acyl carrier protein
MALNTNGASGAAAEIQGWLRENVTGGREVPPDEPLIENGVLTSLQTVELVTFLEERFDIVVEDEEFDEENFGSVEAIASLVANKTA